MLAIVKQTGTGSIEIKCRHCGQLTETVLEPSPETVGVLRPRRKERTASAQIETQTKDHTPKAEDRSESHHEALRT